MKLIIKNTKTKHKTVYKTDNAFNTLFDKRVDIFKDVESSDMENGYDKDQKGDFFKDLLDFKIEEGVYEFGDIQISIIE